jgi:hypothetical protein
VVELRRVLAIRTGDNYRLHMELDRLVFVNVWSCVLPEALRASIAYEATWTR